MFPEPVSLVVGLLVGMLGGVVGISIYYKKVGRLK